MSKLFNPDYLLHLCKKYNLSPSKKYGQNYLIEPEVIDRILAAAELKKTDTVVEIGPGFGVLTLPLAESVKHVISFEIEKKLAPYWDEQIKKQNNIEIKWGNVLKEFSGESLAAYNVVANLPYQITSPVIQLLLEADPAPEKLVLMVQKEVGERITAKPGELSILALAVQYYAAAEYCFTVPRTAFWPSPAVDSAVIALKPNKIARDRVFEKKFFKLLHLGFANRRKLLFKNLLGALGKENKTILEAAFTSAKLTPTVRAQELSLEAWKTLCYPLTPFL